MRARALEDQTVVGLRIAETTPIPAPVKGWNTIDPLSAMDSQYAVQLDNWVPQPGYCTLRKGSMPWVQGVGASIDSLIPYFAGATAKLFAASGTQFYDVSTYGGGATAVYAITNAKNWIWVAFGGVANQYVAAVNGVDKYAFYDGTNWNQATITGVDSSTFAGVAVYQGRLWFFQKGTLQAWYLGAGAIQGAATQFSLASVAKEGGQVLGVTSWSLDAGNGPADYLVFVTDQGEAIVYQGMGPSSVSTFSLVGVYKLPKPIGYKCLLRYASDVLVLTQQGVYPLSKGLLNSTINRNSALTYNISSQFIADFTANGTTYGWEMCLLSEQNLLIVNVPGADPNTGASAQYVMNTLTGAWTRFLGITANCFVNFNGNLIFGDGMVFPASVLSIGLSQDLLGVNPFGDNLLLFNSTFFVEQALAGVFDDKGPVIATLVTAYNYFEKPGSNKHVKLVRPNVGASNSISISVAVSVDFRALQASDYVPTPFVLQNAFPNKLQYPLEWLSPASPPGRAIAGAIQVSSNGSEVRASSFDVLWEECLGITP